MTTRRVGLDLIRRSDVWKITAWLWGELAPLFRPRGWRDDRPIKALRALSPPAKVLLRRYLEEDTKTLRVPTVPSAAIGLELADIVAIYRAPELAGTGDAFVLPINGWALEHLRRHPELLAAELVPRRRGPWRWPWPALGASTMRARGD